MPTTDTVEMTSSEFTAALDKATRKAAKAAAKSGAAQAVRAIKKSDANKPEGRPGGNGSGANVNLNRPQTLTLSKMIRAIGDGSWGNDAALERDFSQANQDLFLQDHEGGLTVSLPSTRSAYAKVIEEAQINLGQPKALRSWAIRASEFEQEALESLKKGDVRNVQAAIRAASEGSTTAGGALVPPEFLQELFTLSLQTAVAFANCPGVTRIPVTSNLIYFPRETVMPASAAYAESATITATDATFGQQAITIKKQAGYNQFSNELLADSTPEYEAFIGRSLARSLALRQDYEYIEGDGTGAHVLGLANYGSLTSGYSVGTNGNAWGQPYISGTQQGGTDFPLQMLGAARAAGWEPNAWISHPNIMSNGLARATDANGRYLLESIGGVFGAPVAVPNVGALATQITYVTPPWKAMLLGAPFFMTSQIPINVTVGSSTDTTTVFTGDFNFGHILERQAIELAKSDQILFTTDQTAVRVTSRSAIVLLAPGAFMAQTGARASIVAA